MSVTWDALDAWALTVEAVSDLVLHAVVSPFGLVAYGSAERGQALTRERHRAVARRSGGVRRVR